MIGFRGGAGVGWLMGRLKLDGGIVSRPLPALDIKQTWANSRAANSCVRISVVDPSYSGNDSATIDTGAILELLLNGNRVLGVNRNGGISLLATHPGGVPFRPSTLTTAGISTSQGVMQLHGSTGVRIVSLKSSGVEISGGFGLQIGSNNNGTDVFLGKLTNSFSAQSSSAIGSATSNGTAQAWIRTFTDSSNYERVTLNVSSNTFIFGPEAAGTGTLRPLYLRTATTTVANLAAAGTVGAGTICHVTDATATTPRSTVAGGGSNFVQVMSDGSAWLIVA